MKKKTNRAETKRQEQERLAQQKKSEITKDLSDRMAVTALVERVVYLLA